MLTHFSYSQLNMFTMCQMRYKFAYIDKIPVPIKGEMVRGDAYHKALAHAYSSIIIYKQHPSIDEILDVYTGVWAKRLKDRVVIDDGEQISLPSVDFKGKDPGKMRNEGIELLKLYHSTILSKIIPKEVEVRKTTTYKGIPLLSYIDLITEDDLVIDHKIKARMFSETELAKDIQSSFYGLVLGKDKFEFCFHTALALKKPEIKLVTIKRDKSDMDWVGRMIVSAWEQIQAGHFTPAIAGWWCAPGQCPYWYYCRMPHDF